MVVYNVDTNEIFKVTLTKHEEGSNPVDGNLKTLYLKSLGMKPIAFEEIYLKGEWHWYRPISHVNIKGEEINFIIGNSVK